VKPIKRIVVGAKVLRHPKLPSNGAVEHPTKCGTIDRAGMDAETNDPAGVLIHDHQDLFDPVAGSFIETLAECAARNAAIIEYGWLSADPTPFPLFSAFQKALTVRGYTLHEFVTDPVLRPKAERFVYDHLEQGELKPKIDRTFPLAQIIEAHRYLESNQQVGKVVVTVP